MVPSLASSSRINQNQPAHFGMTCLACGVISLAVVANTSGSSKHCCQTVNCNCSLSFLVVVEHGVL